MSPARWPECGDALGRPEFHMTLELAPWFNLFTGDNGLGKSFLLDVADAPLATNSCG